MNLENEDEDMDRPVTVNDGSSIRSFAPSHAGTATSSFKNAAKFSRNYDSDDDDNDSKLRTKNLRLNEIKRSDTRVAEDRHSWANAGSSGFSNAYQTSSMTSGTKSRHSKGSRLPPAFATQPLVENDPPRQGYLYQLHKPDLPPSVPTWNTIDPETGAVSGAHRAKKAKHSNNPNHPMNHPLAATFGTINVQEAPDDDDDNATYLTAENLEEQQMFVPQQETADTVAGYCETVLFEADSAAAFYRAPSADDGFDLRSVGSSERPSEKSSVIMSDDGSDASDRTYRPNITNNPRIHRDIRANFISNVDDLHNVDKKSEFQKLNSDWLASDPTTGNVKQINMQLGENNVVAMAVKSEVRTRLFDWHGRYIDGKDRGQVSKRFRRGFLEMVEALEKEMIQASAVYRKWRLMSPTERVRLLEEIRRPVVQFNGTWAPTERDTMEAPLPLIYQKRIEDRYIKAQKLRDLLRERSSNAARTKSVTSHVSHDTREPKNGTLGDCDSEYISEGSIGGTPAGFDDRSRADESFRRAKQNVEESLRRAIRFSEREYSSRVSCRSRQSERRQRDSEQITASLAASSASSRRSSMQTPQQRANDIRGSFQGSGISVAGPRHTSSVKSNATAKPPPSTIRNIRTHGHGGSSSVAQSVGSRNSLDNLSDLLDFDDSPELQLPEDVTGCEAFEFDKPADQELYDIGLRNAQNRGRVVVVRLHQPVEFTPGVIANKVFGGIVQEFQLHPERATAVVVFMHPNEARSFVHHFINVKSHGTEQERRELQMEVSWYKGKERESRLAPQAGLLKSHIGLEATRAIKIHHIPISKTHKVVSDDLGHRLQRIIVMLILSKPQMRHEYEAVGQTCVIEFSSLLDAIEVFHWFMNDKISGYEGSKPQFVPEKTSRPIPGKPYCGCLNCVDARSRETRRKQKRDEELMAQYNRASTRASNSNSNYARTQSGSVPGSANGNKTGKEGSGNPEELDEDLGRLLDDGPEDWEAVPQN